MTVHEKVCNADYCLSENGRAFSQVNINEFLKITHLKTEFFTSGWFIVKNIRLAGIFLIDKKGA